jgi:hypothetical protein
MRFRPLTPAASPLDAALSTILVAGLIAGGYALGFGLDGIFVTIVIIGEVVLREGRKRLKRRRE